MAEIVFKSAPIAAKVKGEKKLSDAASKYVPMIEEMVKTNTARTVTVAHKTPEEIAAAKYLIADVQAAGRACNVTVNKTVSKADANGKVTIEFVTRAKIVQTRRAK